MHRIDFIYWFMYHLPVLGFLYLVYSSSKIIGNGIDFGSTTRPLFVIATGVWLCFWYYQTGEFFLGWIFTDPKLGAILLSTYGLFESSKGLREHYRLDVDDREVLITLNRWTSNLRKWTQGSWWKFPWEKIREIIILKVLPRSGTIEFETQVKRKPEKDSPREISRGGSRVGVEWAFNFQRRMDKVGDNDQEGLAKILTITDEAIEGAFTGYIKGVLQPIVSKFDPVFGFTEEGLKEIRELFQAATEGTERQKLSDVEKRFVIDITDPSIKLKRSDELSDALTLRLTAETLTDVEGGLNYNDAFEKLLVNKGKATRTSARVEGFTAGEQLASLFLTFGRVISDAVQKGGNNTKGGKNRGGKN